MPPKPKNIRKRPVDDSVAGGSSNDELSSESAHKIAKRSNVFIKSVTVSYDGKNKRLYYYIILSSKCSCDSKHIQVAASCGPLNESKDAAKLMMGKAIKAIQDHQARNMNIDNTTNCDIDLSTWYGSGELLAKPNGPINAFGRMKPAQFNLPILFQLVEMNMQ